MDANFVRENNLTHFPHNSYDNWWVERVQAHFVAEVAMQADRIYASSAARRAISAIIQFVKDVSSEVWEAAQVLASGISHAARIAVDAAKTLWRWWNTYVPRWIQ